MKTYTAEGWIENLGLQAHPEGGYYKEVYRSKETIKKTSPNILKAGSRNLATSIYFLLRSEEVSHFHQLESDELWYFHAGDAIDIYVISPEEKIEIIKLGKNIENNESLQVIIPKGSIFGAVCPKESSYCLMGCMVTPAFDFEDFKLFTTTELLQLYPRFEKEIQLLTKENY